eukprot:CAMPEP_0168423714 /NCGR_PEP_ID=MMETSP0228-20121227/34450_1 /TAXON_ID=133427 /ORGANISM="Protoceratium reticulatum, Strain CCCM 535 (=CCMP 1889)" /LENGTH=334 /DNA_ID=CAMNT_0008437683 /DNA_START=55 /DNA_END=1056 /DNA_ORIENTATION=+
MILQPRRGPTFRHHDPAHPVIHGTTLLGARGLSSVFVEASIDEDLTRYLRESSPDPGPGSGGPSLWGLAAEGDEPVLKADWHAVPRLGAEANIFVPRASRLGPMRRAPLRIRAFIEAFREANAACWQTLAAALSELSESEGSGDGLRRLARIFRGALLGREHFGAVEAQVWDGGRLRLRSHADGATSLLHLAVTLGGHRRLRVGRYPEAASGESRQQGAVWYGGDVWEQARGAANLWDVELGPGSAYLASPFCFEHGVLCHGGSDPVVALQCRFALLSKEDAAHVNQLRDRDMEQIATAVTQELAAAAGRGELRLPSHTEVLVTEGRLACAEPR